MSMKCKPKVKISAVEVEESRKSNRYWKKAVGESSKTDFEQGCCHKKFVTDLACDCEHDCEPIRCKSSKIDSSRKLFSKNKSPLQRFDEIVTKELTQRFLSQNEFPRFDDKKKWSQQQFSTAGIPFETKISQTAFQSIEKDLDPPNFCQNLMNADLTDAIERLIQAQMVCQFDAAVKAAEEAAANVSPEVAEEVAVASAKDYQTQIVNFLNNKFSTSDERKPIEVVGYIGIAKKKAKK